MKREEADMDYLDLEAPGLTAGNVEKSPRCFPPPSRRREARTGR